MATGAILTLSTFFMMVRMELTMLEILYAPAWSGVHHVHLLVDPAALPIPSLASRLCPSARWNREAVEAAAAELESESGRNSIQALQTS